MAEEKRFETKIKKYIESLGGYQIKFFANAYTKSGIPDILACVNGYFVGIEVKAQNGHPSELQIHHCNKIRESGGFAFIVYPSGFDTLKKILDDLNKGYFNENLPLILKEEKHGIYR